MRNPFTPHCPPYDRLEYALIAGFIFLGICIGVGFAEIPDMHDRSVQSVLDEREMSW